MWSLNDEFNNLAKREQLIVPEETERLNSIQSSPKYYNIWVDMTSCNKLLNYFKTFECNLKQ